MSLGDKYCECAEPALEIDVTMSYMYCEKCGNDIKKLEKSNGNA